MKKSQITFFSILVLFTFLGTLTFFAASIKKEIAASDKRNNEFFNNIVHAVETNLDHIAEIDFSSGADNISSVSIRHNNEMITCYPNEEVAEGAVSTNLIKIFNKTIVQNEDVYSIKASLYVLRPSVIYSTTKKSFIIILCATVLTIIVLIYETKSEKTAEADSEEAADSEDFIEEEISEDNTQEPVLDNNSDLISEEQTPAEENVTEEESTESESDSEAFSAFDLDNISCKTEKQDESEEPAVSEIQEEEIVTTETEETPSEEAYYQGFPEENKISVEKESFTNKLNTAISKASAEENDLSLYLFEVAEPANEIEIKNLLNEYFYENDVEKISNNVFAAFKANQVIDDAEDYAATIQSRICNFSGDNNCFAGISSKSIRMLGADRLLMEAEEALCHAKDDPSSPIIGFHVDIEKYREFIKNS